MTQKFTIVLEQDGSAVTAHCLELNVLSQGKTMGSALDNVREALNLYLLKNAKAKQKPVNIAFVEV